ncbi:MAG TPA: ATP-binding protein [Polyangiales bacterium]|jgi:PAS domain S-box-containing protein|nr:ATP-binding protein [Polyangiales bacterium]
MTADSNSEREQAELLRTLVEGSFEGLAISIGGKIVEANETFARLTGFPRNEVVGLTIADLATPEGAAIAYEHMRRGVETPYEVVGVRRDGSHVDVELLSRNITYRGQPARITAFRDITERKRAEAERKQLEERVLAVQKLENLGMLAGGVAHDFNNLLLVMLGHAELALGTRPDAAAREHLEQIHTAAERASELTKQLLTYAGRSPTKIEAVDLGWLVRDMSELLRVTVSKKAHVDLQLAPALPAIEADAAQLRQIVMNLMTNASEALGDAQGEIQVRTALEHVDAATLRAAQLDATTGPGQHVVLEVRDTGSGMSASTLARIFDPFFTTKFTGRGLGLASVLGIVRSHRGAIAVRSEPGRGTCFTLYFAPSQRESPPVATRAPADFPELRVQGLALVIDDEPMIRSLTAEILRMVGLDVLTAENGEDGLRVFRQSARPVDLVLLDLTMPRMSGSETLRELRAIAPNVPVILLSGYHEQEAQHEPGKTWFLAKPFEIHTLVETIRDALQRA